MKTKLSLLIAMVLSAMITTRAQYTVLHNLNLTYGEFPYGNLTLVGDRLFGITYYGGKDNTGCIFAIDTNGKRYKDLYDFNLGNGYNSTSLIFANDKLYGLSVGGGTWYEGNIFCIDTNGSGYTDLCDFNYSIGAFPVGSLIQCGSRLFGVTSTGGGIHRLGSIFSIDTNGKGFKPLFFFNDTDGKTPIGSLVVSGSKLFGMTREGGIPYEYGCIFSIDTSGNNFKDLLFFHDTNGRNPSGLLAIAGSELFGMTPEGGMYNSGCIFSIDTSGSYFKDMVDFNGTNGAEPNGSLSISGNVLYGMTPDGGVKGEGIIFSIDTDGSKFIDMFDFDSASGFAPQGDLTLAGNNLFGMTHFGGPLANDSGVIFKFNYTTVGVNEVKGESGEVKVYPNPSTGLFTISCHAELVSSAAASPTITIYSVLGSTIYQAKINSDNTEINLSQPSGIYFYRVLNNDGSVIGEGKLIIQK